VFGSDAAPDTELAGLRFAVITRGRNQLYLK
jgi:hypothetical protein